jgi:hypothetical protein
MLYIVTPVLVPWLWWHNRPADTGEAKLGDLLVPMRVRWLMAGLGIFLLTFALAGFIFPSWLADFWVWDVDKLSARALSGWFALLGVSGLTSAREPRWSGWRIGLQSISIWHVLILIAAALNPDDFTGGSLLNWYIVSVALLEVGMFVLYIWMEKRRWSSPSLVE